MIQARKQSIKQTGKQASKQAGRQAGRQQGRHFYSFLGPYINSRGRQAGRPSQATLVKSKGGGNGSYINIV